MNFETLSVSWLASLTTPWLDIACNSQLTGLTMHQTRVLTLCMMFESQWMEGVLTLVALFEWVECMECVCQLKRLVCNSFYIQDSWSWMCEVSHLHSQEYILRIPTSQLSFISLSHACLRPGLDPLQRWTSPLHVGYRVQPDDPALWWHVPKQQP